MLLRWFSRNIRRSQKWPNQTMMRFAVESLEDRLAPAASFTADVAEDLVGRGAGQIWVAVAQNDHFENQLWSGWSDQVQWDFMDVGDFDGDDTQDVVGRTKDGDWWTGLSRGNSFEAQFWGHWVPDARWEDVQVLDADGDGRDDVAGRASSGDWWVGLSRQSGATNFFDPQLWGHWSADVRWHDLATADANGDGRDDIIGRADFGEWWVALSNGSGFQSQHWATWSDQVTWHDVNAVDLNADQRADIVGRADTGDWWAALSTETGFRNEYFGRWVPEANWRDVKVGDVNGDGRSDVIGRAQQSGDWWAAISNGGSFQNQHMGTWAPQVSWHDINLADVNADGRDDVVGRANGDWWVGASNGFQLDNQFWGSWAQIPWNDVMTSEPDRNVDFNSLPPTGFAPGTVFSAINSAIADLIDELILDVADLEAESEGLLDLTALRTELESTRENFGEFQALVAPVISGQQESVTLGPELLLDRTSLDLTDRMIVDTMLDITDTPTSASSTFDGLEDIRQLAEGFYANLVTSIVDGTRTAVNDFATILATVSGPLAPIVEGTTALTLAAISAALESGNAMIRDSNATVADYSNTVGVVSDHVLNGTIQGLVDRVDEDASGVAAIFNLAQTIEAVANQLSSESASSARSQIEQNFAPLQQRVASTGQSIIGSWNGVYGNNRGSVSIVITTTGGYFSSEGAIVGSGSFEKIVTPDATEIVFSASGRFAYRLCKCSLDSSPTESIGVDATLTGGGQMIVGNVAALLNFSAHRV